MVKDKVILFVDDEELILSSIRSQVGEELSKQFIIEYASSAQEAIELIEDYEIDKIKIAAIVTDWLMPGMKGDKFLIDVHKRYPNILKIMLTGQADKKAINNAQREAQLFRCIEKPWTKEELLKAIDEGLEVYQL